MMLSLVTHTLYGFSISVPESGIYAPDNIPMCYYKKLYAYTRRNISLGQPIPNSDVFYV